jgi:hypothetical protein
MIRFVVFVSTNRDSIGTDSVYTREIDLVGIPSKDVEYEFAGVSVDAKHIYIVDGEVEVHLKDIHYNPSERLARDISGPVASQYKRIWYDENHSGELFEWLAEAGFRKMVV